MHWLQALDVDLLRLINQTLSNPVFDWLMPFASGNPFFIPVVIVAGALFLWNGGRRARLCGLMLLLVLGPGDGLVCNTIKHAVGRPRPFEALPGVRLPARKVNEAKAISSATGGMEYRANTPAQEPNHNSMPSSHAANWFAATMVLLVYYRRSWRIMLPLACLVSISRVYNGVHYPSDILAGGILGAGYAVAGMWAGNALWRWAGPRWFPLWHEQLPSVLNPEDGSQRTEDGGRRTEDGGRRTETHWLRLGYVLTGTLLLAHFIYLGSGLIELSQDEAYQWLWSKHPALSYYSKPPLIAYTQWLGTHLWGDNEFGVRFFSPVISAALCLMVLRFLAREAGARAGVIALLIFLATPLLAAGSVLITVDPLSVLFWTAAMIAGWRAVQPDAETGSWLWTGLWMGLGFLSKYTELFQWLCWIVFFMLWKPARVQLRRPGPYLGLLINLLCASPVLIWNWQHGWPTIRHLTENAGLNTPWRPTARHFVEFLSVEAGLLNPVFFVAMIWAGIAFWRRQPRDPRWVFLFSMGAPLFLCYLLWTLRSSVLPNWIAPSVVPLFCLMVIYWDGRWRSGVRAVRTWLIAGFSAGLAVVVLFHDTDLVQRIAGKPLPPKIDPLTRVRAWHNLAETVNEARTKLLAEGKPVFIIGGHYGITGLVTFYLPEARTNVVDRPLVYYLTTGRPANQFYFWPGYRERRKGQNAIFVREAPEPRLVKRWFPKWLAGQTTLRQTEPQARPAPASLLNDFDSVTDLGLHSVLYHDRIFHTLQLFECRNLR